MGIFLTRAGTPGPNSSLGSISHLQFIVDVGDVVADSFERNYQLVGDGSIGFAASDENQNLPLLVSEFGEDFLRYLLPGGGVARDRHAHRRRCSHCPGNRR